MKAILKTWHTGCPTRSGNSPPVLAAAPMT